MDGAQVLPPGDGRSLAVAGTSIVMKTTAAETGSRWSVLEYAAPPNFAGPAPHWHKGTGEAFFVLDGTIRFEVDGEETDAGAGAYVRVPGSSTASPTRSTFRLACSA